MSFFVKLVSGFKRFFNPWNNKAFFTVLFLLLASALSTYKLVTLPQGGCITYFSLLALWLITYIYGAKHGIICSVLFGFIRLYITYATGEYINTNIFAIILEYPLAFGIFGVMGLFNEPEKTNRDYGLSEGPIKKEPYLLRVGYLLGVFGQFVFYIISAELFYEQYRPSFFANLWYNIVYDGSYLLVEALLSIILISIPPVAEAIYYIKHVATHPLKDNTNDMF